MKSRPRLDERSFEQLLAAAYVVQQQRDPLRSPSAVPATAPLSSAWASSVELQSSQSSTHEAARLALIAETQTAVHSKKLSLQESLQLVIERAAGITRGAGAAIWLLQGKNAVCQAAFGTYKAGVGQSIAIEGSRLARCFREGQILRCEDARSDPRVRYDALPGRADGSLLAVPIYHEGRVEGALEVTFALVRGFAETDLRTCQILSGLVGEAVALSAEQEWKHVLESERATLLEALDRIQPHLSKLLNGADRMEEGGSDLPTSAAETPSTPVAHSYGMANLGKFLLAQQEQEKDAGIVTAHVISQHAEPAERSEPAPREVQTALNLSVVPQRPNIEARPWLDEDMDSADRASAGMASANTDATRVDSLKIDSPKIGSPKNGSPGILRTVASGKQDFRSRDLEENGVEPKDFEEKEFEEQDFQERNFREQAEVSTEHESAALELRDIPWLDAEVETPAPEQSPLTTAQQFWKLHWADVCLAASAVVLAATLVWAVWFQPSNTRDSLTAAQQPKLTAFEELLVAVGLAEPPPPVAVNMGTPGTRVWVDLHSALYYCPGAEPYGKTPKGKYLTQHEAQYEQFQPARGQPCD